MSTASTAKNHHSIARHDLRGKAEEQHLRIMIESMLRAGCSEREIVAAVERATGR